MLLAQTPQTIKVRKESDLVKAYFDPSEFKLFPIDRYGNPKDNRVMGFKLYVKTKRSTKEFESFTANLSSEMIEYLNSLSLAAKLFFTNIVVEEKDASLVKLPDVIEVWFPKPNQNKKRK